MPETIRSKIIIFFISSLITAVMGVLGFFLYSTFSKINAIHEHQIKAIAYIKQLEEVKIDTDDLKERMIKMESKDK